MNYHKIRRGLGLRIKSTLKSFWGLNAPNRAVTVLPDDRFLVSYPRSGNTWARFWLANLLSPQQSVTFATIEQYVPDIYQIADKVLLTRSQPRILKSHEYFDPQYKQVIYLVRDPRDVVVSYYHYHLKNHWIDAEFGLSEFVDRFLCGELPGGYGSWGENAGSWLGAREHDEMFLLCHYEEMLSQPLGTLRRMADFLGIQVDDASLQAAIKASDADRMRHLEKKESEQWQTTKGSDMNQPFVRVAQAGRWQEALPVAEAEKIIAQWYPLLQRLGYV